METGTVTSWKEDKKFGFIKSSTSGKEIFFHISDIKSGSRKPNVGEVLQFEVQTRNDGKIRASNVCSYTKYDRRKKTLRILSLSLLAIPVVGCILFIIHGIYGPLVAYLVTIPLSYYAYKDDKAKAKNGQWRTPEATLHFIDLLGGWYGGLYAQKTLFHKNKKGTFQFVFWLTVIAHQAAWVFFIIRFFKQYFLTL